MPGTSRIFRSFTWKICLALALIALGDLLFYQWHLYGGHFGFLALALIACVLASQTARLRDKRVWLALILAALFALALLNDPGPLALLLFWTAISMAVLIARTGPFDDGWRWFQRLLTHGCAALLGPLVDLARTLRARRASRRRGKRRVEASSLFALLALPVAGSIVIIWLFSTANPIIADLLARISFPRLDFFHPLRVILWGFLGIAVWSLLRPRHFGPAFATFDGSGDLAIPGVSVASVILSLILFNLLFAVQNLLDILYLWEVMPLPRGMTLAGYAHRGAYPLIVTALLALLFVLVTLRPRSATASSPAIRALVIVWIGQNIFLVASSMQRTIDYIDAYQLTEMRIAALAWMALVAVGLLLICWRMLRGKSASWLIDVNLAAAGLVLTICCFVDLGAVAAQHNVRHAREVGGRGVPLDLCYLSRLGDAALLPLIELENRPLPLAFRQRVQSVRMASQSELEWQQRLGGWSWRSARRMEAARVGARGLPLLIGKEERQCNGTLVPQPPPPPPSANAGEPSLTAGAGR